MTTDTMTERQREYYEARQAEKAAARELYNVSGRNRDAILEARNQAKATGIQPGTIEYMQEVTRQSEKNIEAWKEANANPVKGDTTAAKIESFAKKYGMTVEAAAATIDRYGASKTAQLAESTSPEFKDLKTWQKKDIEKFGGLGAGAHTYAIKREKSKTVKKETLTKPGIVKPIKIETFKASSETPEVKEFKLNNVIIDNKAMPVKVWNELPAEYRTIALSHGFDKMQAQAEADYKNQEAALKRLEEYKSGNSYDIQAAMLTGHISDKTLRDAGFTQYQIDSIKANTVSIVTEEKKKLPEIPIDEFAIRYFVENNAPAVLLKHRGLLKPSEENRFFELKNKWYGKVIDAYQAQYGSGSANRAALRSLPGKVGFPAVSKLIEPTRPTITASDIVWTAVNLALLAWGVKAGIRAAIPRIKATLKPVSPSLAKTAVGDVQPAGWAVEFEAVSPEFTPRGKLYTGGTLIDIGAGKVAYIKPTQTGGGGAGRQLGFTYQEIYPRSQGYIDALELKQGFSFKKGKYYNSAGQVVTQATATKSVKVWRMGTPTGQELREVILAQNEALRQALIKKYPELKALKPGQQLPPGKLYSVKGSKAGEAFKGTIGESELKALIRSGKPLFKTVREETPLSPGGRVTEIKTLPDDVKLSPALERELIRAGRVSGKRSGSVTYANYAQQYQIVDADIRNRPVIRIEPVAIPSEIQSPVTKTRTTVKEETKPKPEEEVKPVTAGQPGVKPGAKTSVKPGVEPGAKPEVKPEPAPQPKPVTKTPVTTAVKTTTKQAPPQRPTPKRTPPPPIKPKPPLPGDATDKEKRQYIKDSNGAIGWRQGEVGGKDRWDVIVNPYQSNEDYVMVLGAKPKGAVVFVKGPGSARQTAQMLYGKPPGRQVKVDSGFQDVTITPNGKKISLDFTPDPKLETKGDITIGGKTPRISPKMPRLR